MYKNRSARQSRTAKCCGVRHGFSRTDGAPLPFLNAETRNENKICAESGPV